MRSATFDSQLNAFHKNCTVKGG
uniref:Uncharacterized protein n=1 Tax=Rhizophora mucronata TaxID=61149 RepID=A0A2P2LB22_RHIMU